MRPVEKTRRDEEEGTGGDWLRHKEGSTVGDSGGRAYQLRDFGVAVGLQFQPFLYGAVP